MFVFGCLARVARPRLESSPSNWTVTSSSAIARKRHVAYAGSMRQRCKRWFYVIRPAMHRSQFGAFGQVNALPACRRNDRSIRTGIATRDFAAMNDSLAVRTSLNRSYSGVLVATGNNFAKSVRCRIGIAFSKRAGVQKFSVFQIIRQQFERRFARLSHHHKPVIFVDRRKKDLVSFGIDAASICALRKAKTRRLVFGACENLLNLFSVNMVIPASSKVLDRRDSRIESHGSLQVTRSNAHPSVRPFDRTDRSSWPVPIPT